MEQWNMKFGGWRMGGPFEYCDLDAERRNYKGVTYTLEQMLWERFLSKCLLEWDESIGKNMNGKEGISLNVKR